MIKVSFLLDLYYISLQLQQECKELINVDDAFSFRGSSFISFEEEF